MSAPPPPIGGPMALLALARDNKPTEIEALVKRGFPVNLCNQMGQTPLHIAALWGNLESIETLVRLGADVNIKNMRGATPLHFAAAAKSNAKSVCELLIKLGADQEEYDALGRQPYELAEDDEVRVLLGGPDPRLFQLAAAGKADELKALLEGGGISSVRVLDHQGRTPLNMAIAAESLDTVKVLLGRDPRCLDMPDGNGDSSLHAAAAVGDLDILRFLLTHKPETLDMQNMDRSEYSAGNWMLNGEVVEPLDKTPLHVAVEAGDVPVATVLLEAGAQVNILDYSGRTALLMAVEEGDLPMIELLVAHGADPNILCKDFVSCAHHLATKGPIKALELLIAKGLSVKKVNDDGWTPLHLAARSGKEDRAALLLKAGANTDAANSQGNTPLHLAAINGHLGTVKLLLAAGAKKDVVNKQGNKAVDVAKTQEIRDVLA